MKNNIIYFKNNIYNFKYYFALERRAFNWYFAVISA